MKKFIFFLLLAVVLFKFVDFNIEINTEDGEVQMDRDEKTVEIPFYYDHSKAPSKVSKKEVLDSINKASAAWENSCGVSFKYDGDVMAEDLNGLVENVPVIIGSHIGIIKWQTVLSEDSAVGEAPVGDEQSPVFGFVMNLNSASKFDLAPVIAHEFGHVIGLDHSEDDRSIMASATSAKQSLRPNDANMCLYLKARWFGMDEKEAMTKFGLVYTTNTSI